MLPKFDQRQFLITGTGDQNKCVHYFRPVRKLENKMW